MRANKHANTTTTRRRSRRRKTLYVAVPVVLLLAAVGSCDSPGDAPGVRAPAASQVETTPAAPGSPAPPEQAPADEEPDPTPEPEVDEAEGLARRVEAGFMEAYGGRAAFDEACARSLGGGAAGPHWSCYYEGVEPHSTSTVRVVLSTTGDVSSRADAKGVAEETARHWFNFVGPDNPGLGTIIVRVDGVDHNEFRRDYPGASL